jgi:hypothetical protein
MRGNLAFLHSSIVSPTACGSVACGIVRDNL